MKFKYFAYNILKTDYSKLNQYINQLSKERKLSKIYIIKDMLDCFFRNDTRFLDYFYFKFFDENADRKSHTNVWDMHKFHKKFNGKNSIILRNKLLFRERFNAYFNYPYFELKDNNQIPNLINWIKEEAKGRETYYIVAKEPLGTVGKGVQILQVSYDGQAMYIGKELADMAIKKLLSDGFKLYEGFIEQHPTLSAIHPQSINTIRIVSFVDNNKNVEIWAALLRIGYGKSIDNFDAGGLSAKVDIESGKVITAAVLKDPFSSIEFERHPITNTPILGIQIPFWSDVKEIIHNASLELEDVRTVGWDIAITVNGPTLIEGNDNWDKTHFELASRTGLNCKIKPLISES